MKLLRRKPNIDRNIFCGSAAFKIYINLFPKKVEYAILLQKSCLMEAEIFRNRKRDVNRFMAKELQQTLPEARRKRVQRLKKMVIGIVAAGIVIPLLCCVYLICRLHTIDGTLRDLEQRLDELDIRDQELQTLLQQYSQRYNTEVSKYRRTVPAVKCQEHMAPERSRAGRNSQGVSDVR